MHNSPPFRSLVIILTVLAVLAGITLRFTNLSGKVLWHDEAHTALRVSGYTTREFVDTAFVNHIYTRDELLSFQHPTAGQGWSATLHALMSRPEHAPLYYLLARVGFLFTDNAKLATRVVAVLLSLLLLPTAAWLWCELFGELQGAWLIVGLLALSPFQLVYAQEARQYSLWAVMTLAVCAGLLYARRRNDRQGWLLYTALVVVGLYTHLMLLVALVAQTLWMAWVGRARLKPFLLSLTAAVLLFSPWLLLLIDPHNDVGMVTAWMKAEAPLEILRGAWLAHLTHQFFDTGEPRQGSPFILVLVAFGLYSTARYASRDIKALLFLLLLCTVGVVVGPDVIEGGRRSLEARYLLPALLVLMFMIAYGLAHALSSGRRVHRGAALALWVGLLWMGLWTDLRYARAGTWWNKSMSRDNHEVARLIDLAPHPLVLTTDGPINPGELLSVAHEVDAQTQFMPVNGNAPPEPNTLVGDVFLITPSPELLRHFSAYGFLTELNHDGRLWSFQPSSYVRHSTANGLGMNRVDRVPRPLL